MTSAMTVPFHKKGLFFLLFLLSGVGAHAQVDSTAQEEDYSIYDQVEFADEKARRYCSPKIFNQSPQRFISLQYDGQLAHDMRFSPVGSYAEEDQAPVSESATATFVGGMRLSANIPVISKNSLVWQMGANYWQTDYRVKDLQTEPGSANLIQELDQTGLRTMGLNTTLFKPLGEFSFLLFQGSADLSGNYTFKNFQSLRYLRYSAAAIWGRRPNDRKQWGVGLARTYRVGEMNYIPVVMFNYTSPNRKWGTEILFPARAHYRRTFNPRNLMLVGYELEGQSYRMDYLSDTERSLEIRRGEMRARVEFQRQITGFIWFSAQVGWRYNWSFNADALPNDGKEFFRGFTGSQTYAMLNTLGNPLYFNIGVHLVSP
jgi:hypothetical protein